MEDSYEVRNLHYQVSKLESKIERLQQKVWETQKMLTHSYLVSGYYAGHDILNPTLEQMKDAEDYADSKVGSVEFEKKVWKKVLEI